MDKLRLKRSLFKTYKKYPTVKNYNAYARARNQVKWESRKAVRSKEQLIADQVKSNPKALYRYVSSKIKTNDPIPNLFRENSGIETESDQEKAETLNDFFSSVFTLEDGDSVPYFRHPDKILRFLENIYITEEKMYEALKSMKVCKSPGPDKVHPRVLRELARELTFPLTQLFNRTMEEGSLP